MPDVIINIMFSGAPCDITNCITKDLKNKKLDTLKNYFEKGIDDIEGIHYSVELFSGDWQGRPKPNTYVFVLSSEADDNVDYQLASEKIKMSEEIVTFLNKNAEKR